MATNNQDKKINMSFKLDHMPLVFGVMRKLGIAEIVNYLLPKTGPNVLVQCGTILETMIARHLSGEMQGGINSIQSFIASLPANILAESSSNFKECNPFLAINRDVVGNFLDRVAEYGPSRFSSEIISQCIDCTSVTVANIDSTDYHFHGEPIKSVDLSPKARFLGPKIDHEDELLEVTNKPINLLHGYSRDDKPDLPKVNSLGVSAKVNGIDKAVMIYQAAFSGNENDVSRFQEFAGSGELKYIKGKYPNLKVLVGDSAAATSKTIFFCKQAQIDLVTRLPDRRVKKDFDMLNEGKIKLSEITLPIPKWQDGEEPQKVQYAWLDDVELGGEEDSVKVSRILFVGENMRAKKTATIQKKAEKELAKKSTEIEKLKTQPKSCKADALAEFNKIKKGCKLVTISEPEIEEVMGYASRGRPKADDPRVVTAVKVIAKASIDKKKVEEAISSELYYVIATTDTEIKKNKTNALHLYQTYHGQVNIETQWRDIKAPSMFFDSLYLKNPERIKAMLAIVSISLFIGRVLMTHVINVFQRDNISIRRKGEPRYNRPELKSFIRYAREVTANTIIIIIGNQIFIPDIEKSILYRVAKEIGEEAMRFYTSDFYLNDINYIYKSRMEYNDLVLADMEGCNS